MIKSSINKLAQWSSEGRARGSTDTYMEITAMNHCLLRRQIFIRELWESRLIPGLASLLGRISRKRFTKW